MKRLVLCVAVLLFACVGDVKGDFIFNYTGTFHRDAYDHAGIEGAHFTCTARFPSSPYVDDGFGLPSLTAMSVTFTVSGAPLPESNADYLQDNPLVMYPTLGGKATLVKFVHPITGWTTGPRLIANFDALYGGNGLGATIGQMPELSDFPTEIFEPQFIALPHNIPYEVLNAAMTSERFSEPSTIPEPSTLIVWSLLGASGIGIGWWRRKRAA